MSKIETYRQTLRLLDDWDAYLLSESGLPGPRGNLELAQAAASEGDLPRFEHWLSFGPARAPANTPEEFLHFCGVVGLGRLASEAPSSERDALLGRLRPFAADPRWRTREAVAMALQRLGEADMDRMLDEAQAWSAGSWLELRAAAAAIAEPPLLHEATHAARALRILDGITAAIAAAPAAERKSEGFKVLRQGMAYCWSVAVAALPDEGKRLMEKWLDSDDPDARWMMRENLKKKRLERIDPAWVRARLKEHE